MKSTGICEIEKHPFHVDGEAGRYNFLLYKVDTGVRTFSSSEYFPPQHWNEYYRTVGYKKLAYIYGDTEVGFAKTTNKINEIRHQSEGGTPLKTLHDGSVKEGLAIQEYLRKNNVVIFKKNNFTDEGVPREYINIESPAVERNGKNKIGYECPGDTVNIKIDDVLVKRQESTHQKQKSKITSVKKKPRKNTSNTVCTINSSGEKYALNGFSTKETLVCLVSFLLHNKLMGKRFLFFTDGLPSLNKSIETCFSWYHNWAIILDWYHLELKCKERLSMGIKDRKYKNMFFYNKLRPFLWSGDIKSAIRELEGIEDCKVKNQEEVDKLMEYLQRNKRYIPCYKKRKERGLCNSSNECEKMNDILVSTRQKNNGMSWVKEGSVALASLTGIKKNDEFQQWFKTGTLEYKLVA